MVAQQKAKKCWNWPRPRGLEFGDRAPRRVYAVSQEPPNDLFLTDHLPSRLLPKDQALGSRLQALGNQAALRRWKREEDAFCCAKSDELGAVSVERSQTARSSWPATRRLMWKSCEIRQLTGRSQNDIFKRFRGRLDSLWILLD